MSKGEADGSDDLLMIEEDMSGSVASASERSWRVLVVDDDEEVHEATRFALSGISILDHPVRFFHARSAAEALQIAENVGDLAVALVDVVMEQPDAGLRLVRDLRSTGYTHMRIALRTGQPGYAPERVVIEEYEIDDYRTKAELTQSRLITVLTTAIRAYDQIRTIANSRAGLEMIVESATSLFQRTSLALFSQGVLTQIASLLGIVPNGAVFVNVIGENGSPGSRIVSAVGRYSAYIDCALEEIPDVEARSLLEKARGRKGLVFEEGRMVLGFKPDKNREILIYIEADREIDPENLGLLKIFSTNIAIGFENLGLVERLDHLAYVDPVLEVPNLNAFEQELRRRLADGRRDGVVALMSVDSFHSIVAAFGPSVANTFLHAVYEDLVRESGVGLTAARVGDGTFAFLGDSGDFQNGFLSKALDKSYWIDDIEISATATSALVDLADLEPKVSAIMRNANSALLHTKRTNRGKSVNFDSGMQRVVDREFELTARLKKSLERGEGFVVHAQPKFSLPSQRLVGSEALLRWTCDGLPISPTEFIPLAESSGLTQRLTEMVVREIGAWAARRGENLPCVPVAVNLSVADLKNPGFASRLLSVVADAGLSPRTLEFEVTEGIAMGNNRLAVKEVRVLKDAGFKIALDDFGTGYSSLGRLDMIEIDVLKIDRRFVAPLTIENARGSLAAVIVGMAQTLGVECVAEGIETEEQKQALTFLGCESAQGFLLGRPVPIDEFDARFSV